MKWAFTKNTQKNCYLQRNSSKIEHLQRVSGKMTICEEIIVKRLFAKKS